MGERRNWGLGDFLNKKSLEEVLSPPIAKPGNADDNTSLRSFFAPTSHPLRLNIFTKK